MRQIQDGLRSNRPGEAVALLRAARSVCLLSLLVCQPVYLSVCPSVCRSLSFYILSVCLPGYLFLSALTFDHFLSVRLSHCQRLSIYYIQMLSVQRLVCPNFQRSRSVTEHSVYSCAAGRSGQRGKSSGVLTSARRKSSWR